MSVVTSIVFTCGLLDNNKLPAVNDIISDIYGMRQELHDMRDHAGGGKALQACVWVGAFNYFDEKAFHEGLKRIKWDDAGSVRIYYNREHEDGFSLVATFLDGFTPPLAPEPWT